MFWLELSFHQHDFNVFLSFLQEAAAAADVFSFFQVYERSYLRTQREQYLQQQLELEQKASEIVFHTISITNALSPDEYFEQVSRHAIQDMFEKDPFGKCPSIGHGNEL